MSFQESGESFLGVLFKITVLVLDSMLIMLSVVLPIILAAYATACYYCGITAFNIYLITGIVVEISLAIVICVVTSTIKYL